MKVVEIGQVLAVTSKIYEEAGNTEVARGILTVAQLLQDYRVGTVTAFVGQLKRELTQRRAADDNTQKPQGAAGTVKIFEIRAVLDKLGFIYVSSGAKSQAGDCMRLSEMLGDHEGELVETFAKRARDALFQKNQNNIAQTGTEGLDAGKYAPK